MKIYYQPTESSPCDWRIVQSSDWASLGQFHLHAMSVQGLVFEGPDHYAIEHMPDGKSVRAFMWHDDPEDWPPGQRWAREVLLNPLAPDPDPRLGGAYNTDHYHTIYAEEGIMPVFVAAYGDNPRYTLKPWTDFDTQRVNPLPGLWVPDGLHDEHQCCRSVRPWREYTEGIQDERLISPEGLLVPQRRVGLWVKPTGTRTYYHNATDLASGTHNVTNENQLGLTPAGVATEDSPGIGTSGKEAFLATTPPSEPDSAAWPTTGTYRYQMDVLSAGTEITFGVLNQGTAEGHFARVSSDLATEYETFQQDQSAFSGAGLHLASITDPAWTSGATSDRFEILIAGVKVTGHGNQSFTLQLGELDDYADGPWAAPVAAVGNAMFFGGGF